MNHDLVAIRQHLIELRDDCLGPGLDMFDADGAVILSHAIRWLHFKIEGKPYEHAID